MGVGVKTDGRTEPNTDPATDTGTASSKRQAAQGIRVCGEELVGMVGEIANDVHRVKPFESQTSV